MRLNLTSSDTKAQIQIVLVKNKKIIENKSILDQLNFKGQDEEVVVLIGKKKLYVGCENPKDKESIKIAASCAIRKLNTTKITTASIECKEDEISSVIEGLELGNYEFAGYKTKKEEKEEKELSIIVSEITKKIQNDFKSAIEISDSVNMTRDMVNTTPNNFYPKIMAVEAEIIAKENNLECKIFGENFLKKNNMNAMLAVGRASVHKSKLIHLIYKPENAKKKIVLVGKGLTYDSGGLSLKPSDYMTTMKSDKSGACAILGAINAVAKLKLPYEVHCVVGAVENMIGGNAYKPDDVLIARNGKSIEIKNTDAEGRLVLADCLTYAQDEIKNIDYIFDYATLTGACMVGVGEYTSGIMGNNKKLCDRVIEDATNSGELSTFLPFNRYLTKSIKSEIADICNIASTRYGGAVTAGMFLDNFIEEKNKDKWIHFDIAGPAFVEHSWGYNPYGASGAGVRMTVEFIKNLK